MQNVIRAFRERRRSLHLTQTDIAKAARVSRQTVSDFENGRTAVTLPNLLRLLSSVGLELTTRELSSRPTLDELADRYSDSDAVSDTDLARDIRKRAP